MHRKITRQSRWNLRRASDWAIPNQAPGIEGGQTLAPLSVGSIGYPSAWARPRRARFCFTWQGYCSSAPRGLLKRERHRLEIKSRLVCLLQEIYTEISVEEFAGFGSVCQQDRRGAEDYQESPDAEMQ
jgi:hypothetical protein